MTPETIAAAQSRIEVLEVQLLGEIDPARRAEVERQIGNLLEPIVETSEEP